MKKEIEIVVPSNWSEVSLKSYQDYNSKINDLKGQDEIIIHSISTLCNVPAHIVSKLRVKDIQQVYLKLSKLISIPINKEIVGKISLGGKEFGFHPNLDEMSLGEFVDLDEYTKDGVNGIQYIMSILYRPITETKGSNYNIEPYTDEHIKNAVLFEQVSIDHINGVMIFFYHLGSKSLKNSLNYLSRMEGSKRHEVIMGGSLL